MVKSAIGYSRLPSAPPYGGGRRGGVQPRPSGPRPILTPCGEGLFDSSFAVCLSRARESGGLAAGARLVGNRCQDFGRIGRFGALRSQAMKLGRKKRKDRGTAEPAAARIGLKPPGGGKLKWIRVGFAWDLFVLSPLLGVPLFLRKL